MNLPIIEYLSTSIYLISTKENLLFVFMSHTIFIEVTLFSYQRSTQNIIHTYSQLERLKISLMVFQKDKSDLF